MAPEVERYEFQTETRQLLDLMVHSIYSNKDIFLRELISNASDALDRRRYEALSHPERLDAGVELHVLLRPDTAARTLSIVDNGIGMSRDEVIRLIGTIAKSGTREFAAALRASKDQEQAEALIGQFGVGFYSSFMVADKVTLETRRAGETGGTRWESAGDGAYTLESIEKDETGTTVTLHLKAEDSEDGLHDYTAPWIVKDIVKRYSDFVAYPVKLESQDKDGEVKTEVVNSMKAIWLRDSGEVPDHEYNEFYKHLAHDFHDPLHRIQAKIEGTLEYRMLLFIPASAPWELLFRPENEGVHLYVRRVFIMDDCTELLPPYLRFVRGVVDSEDLSLNVSRELLQQNRQIQRMRRGIVSKVLDELKKLSENNAEAYNTFWRNQGRTLKEGLYLDRDNREALLGLLRAHSSSSGDALTPLADYATRMQSGQDRIYYLTGESRAILEQSPHLEAFKAKGYEVLFFTDPVDEVWLQQVGEYQGKTFQSAAKGAAELGSEEERREKDAALKEKEKTYHALLEALQTALDSLVKEVRLSARLTESAACLVGDTQDMSPQLEQLMRALKQEVPAVKRILEVNPAHPVLERLRVMHEANPDDPRLSDYVQLLYGQAALAEGGQVPNPSGYAKLVAKLMVDAG